MKKRHFLGLLLGGYLILVWEQTYSQTFLQNVSSSKIQSVVEITSDTRPSVVGANEKNINTIPTGRKQKTIRQIELKKEEKKILGFFIIQHIKASIYGGDGESIYDSDNSFERSGNAEMFAVRADPWIGKKIKTSYEETGLSINPINDNIFFQTWLTAIPLLSPNPELSGVLQISIPKSGWVSNVTWTDTLRGLNSTYINTYKVIKVIDQTVTLSLNGKATPFIDSSNGRSESTGVYSGSLEISKVTGVIQKMELKRESERSSTLMNTKILSTTITKISVSNKVL